MPSERERPVIRAIRERAQARTILDRAITDNLDRRTVATLREHGPMRALELGRRLWFNTLADNPANRDAVARTAVKVLRRLRGQHRVKFRICGRSILWEAKVDAMD